MFIWDYNDNIHNKKLTKEIKKEFLVKYNDIYEIAIRTDNKKHLLSKNARPKIVEIFNKLNSELNEPINHKYDRIKTSRGPIKEEPLNYEQSAVRDADAESQRQKPTEKQNNKDDLLDLQNDLANQAHGYEADAINDAATEEKRNKSTKKSKKKKTPQQEPSDIQFTSNPAINPPSTSFDKVAFPPTHSRGDRRHLDAFRRRYMHRGGTETSDIGELSEIAENIKTRMLLVSKLKTIKNDFKDIIGKYAPILLANQNSVPIDKKIHQTIYFKPREDKDLVYAKVKDDYINDKSGIDNINIINDLLHKFNEKIISIKKPDGQSELKNNLDDLYHMYKTLLKIRNILTLQNDKDDRFTKNLMNSLYYVNNDATFYLKDCIIDPKSTNEDLFKQKNIELLLIYRQQLNKILDKIHKLNSNSPDYDKQLTELQIRYNHFKLLITNINNLIEQSKDKPQSDVNESQNLLDEEELRKLRKSKDRLLELIKEKAPRIYPQVIRNIELTQGGNNIIGGLNIIQKAGNNNYNQNFSLIKDSLHLIPSREMINNVELDDVLISAHNIIHSIKYIH